MTNGVIYIATGEIYRQAAVESAKSVRKHSPGLGIDLFTDATPVGSDVFDEIHIIDNPHRRSKVDHIHRTRFDRTLYLDSDTRVIADISGMFEILDRYDIAATHAHARNRVATQELWRTAIPNAFSQMNCGVMLFRSTEDVINLLRAWQEAFHTANFSKDQVTFRELVWESSLRLYILPPEYNIRYSRYIDFWEDWEAQPRILHYAEFHKSPSISGTNDSAGHSSWKRLLRKLQGRR